MAAASKYSTALVEKYEGLFRSIDKAQWEIGKSLHEDQIISDGARQRLGDLIGRAPKTLKTYYEVYVNFMEIFPDGRPDTVSHGVLEELIRLPKESDREEFLNKSSKPTRVQAMSFVDSKLKSDSRPSREPRKTDTTNISLNGVRFELADKGESGTVTIFGIAKAAGLRQDIAGNWVLEYAK